MQQVKRHKTSGVWDLSAAELRLLLYLEAGKLKYNGGVENRARVAGLLKAVSKKSGD